MGVRRARGGVMAASLALLFLTARTAAPVCSSVTMRIPQDVTFERQGFEATLTIHNGSDRSDVAGLGVFVEAFDPDGTPVGVTDDPDDVEAGAAFFVRLDSAGVAGAVDGSGRVPAGSSATIRWTLIPAVGTGGVTPDGAPYLVGARISYEIESAAYELAVHPDAIWVMPLPDIEVDCFVPTRVHGDDPWTAEVEPSVPATLGMRLRNAGLGAAHAVSVAAMPPVVLDNRTGLPVEFSLLSGAVNGQPAHGGLRVAFGTLDPGACAVASWRIAATLMGICSQAGAHVSHADSLGGSVTALIRQENVRSHDAIRAVLVDLPGRDEIEDFLTVGGLVYESGGVDGPWAAARVGGVWRQQDGSLIVELDPVSAGMFAYARVDDWDAGSWSPSTSLRATRDDGSMVPARNVWVSLEPGGTVAWTPALHLFDASGRGGRYRIEETAGGDADAGIEIVCAPSYATRSDRRLRFEVQAVASDGSMPVLSAGPLPAGAAFESGGDRGAFDWFPSDAQEGGYSLRLTAVSGDRQASRTVGIEVQGMKTHSTGALFMLH